MSETPQAQKRRVRPVAVEIDAEKPEEITFQMTYGPQTNPITFLLKSPAKEFLTKLNDLIATLPNLFENLGPVQELQENENAVRFIAGNYQVTPNDSIIVCDASNGDIIVSLCSATAMGLHLLIVKEDTSGNTVTVNTFGADNMEGVNSKTLSARYDKLVIVSDGVSSWYILPSEEV